MQPQIEFSKQVLTARRSKLWHHGENLTVQRLQMQGWRVLNTNWRVGKFSEIDIIARDQTGLLVFIEVKTRITAKEPGIQMQGFESVGYSKRQKIVTSAMIYLHQNRLLEQGYRIDVVVVNYEMKVDFDPDESGYAELLNAIDMDNPTVTHIQQAVT